MNSKKEMSLRNEIVTSYKKYYLSHTYKVKKRFIIIISTYKILFIIINHIFIFIFKKTY